MVSACPHCYAPCRGAHQKFCNVCGSALSAFAAAPGNGTFSPQSPGQTVHIGQGLIRASLVIEDGVRTQPVALSTSPVAIGRAPHNQIVLTSPFVSANHARIEPDGVGHCIIDLGSTNGLLYQGVRVAAHTPITLTHGDPIRIGDPISGNFISLTYLNLLAVRVPQIQRLSLPAPGGTLLIGRAHGQGIWDNPQVSRDHAALITQANGIHLLRDLGSTNGTYVNGKPIGIHPLQVGDHVQIGPFKLVYNGHELVHQDQSRGMRIEARRLNVQRTATNITLTRRIQSWIAGQPIPPKLILRDVSLCIEPGEFVALVGGSGAGKSTLMGALSGFNHATSGTVHVNGDNFYQNFAAYRSVLGYVPQDDIIHRMLPVARALDYTAQLRLPTDMSPQEVTERITRVLHDVELDEHRSTMVDRLSGGQRKRVSISAELLADPSLFFLDEPTSGLDPGLEKKMMYTLRRLADGGRTVVLVTHATANIDQCDLIAFMALGRLVYYGPPDAAKTFFGVTSNDFADIYTRLDGRYDPTHPALAQDTTLQQAYRTWQSQHPGGQEQPYLAELWEAQFLESPYCRQYVQNRIGHTPALVPASGGASSPAAPALPMSPWRQWRLLTRRYFDLLLQDRRNFMILLLQAPIIALLMALVLDREALTGSNATFSSARSMLFTLATVAVWFGIINAAREITKEASIYRRERLANLQILPYVLSKVAVLSGLVLVQSLILLLIVGLKVDLTEHGLLLAGSVELWLTTVLAAFAGLTLGLLISTIAATPDRAISIVPLALIPQIIFSGVVFTLDGGAKVLSWLAVGRWAMDGYGTTADLNSLPTFAGGQPPTPAYDEYTHSLGQLLTRWLILMLFSSVCLVLTVWLLRRKDMQR